MAVSTPNMSTLAVCSTDKPGFFEKLTDTWHKPALLTFMAIVIGHWGNIFFRHIKFMSCTGRGRRRWGCSGWLSVAGEDLKPCTTVYCLVMLIGIWMLRKGFTGVSHTWWMIAFWIQFWHHIEHALLQYQALTHHNFFILPVPTSILQLWFPRVELHLFYNSIVFIPMVIGMYYHMFPPEGEEQHAKCNCAWHAHEPSTAWLPEGAVAP